MAHVAGHAHTTLFAVVSVAHGEAFRRLSGRGKSATSCSLLPNNDLLGRLGRLNVDVHVGNSEKRQLAASGGCWSVGFILTDGRRHSLHGGSQVVLSVGWKRGRECGGCAHKYL